MRSPGPRVMPGERNCWVWCLNALRPGLSSGNVCCNPSARHLPFPGPRAGVQGQGLQRIGNLLNRFQRHLYLIGFDLADTSLIGIDAQGPFFL